MVQKMDYEKLPSDKNVGFWIGPTGDATGIQDVDLPSAAEVNNQGGVSNMMNAVVAVSWNDYDFAVQAPETTSDPSFADESTYEDLGPTQWGGGVSFYYPGRYHDPTNSMSEAYDLTKTPWTYMDVVTRIDGVKPNPTTPISDGDFVSVYRVWTDSESNVLEADTAYRRTVGMQMAGEAAFYTVVGPHTITTNLGATPWAAGSKGRIQGVVQDRDYTSKLEFVSSDSDVVQVYPGGFYTVTGSAADTATITIYDRGAGTSTTEAVTVT